MTRNGRLVGVIEDDVSVRGALQRLLHASGVQVSLFATAEDFFVDPHRAEVDCLVIDVCLPGMSGLELLEKIRAESPPSAPAIVITSNDDECVRSRAMAAGANAFFLKPFDNRQLQVAVSNALESSP
ncbi:MAG: response regulator [Planctomycetales bacterium]